MACLACVADQGLQGAIRHQRRPEAMIVAGSQRLQLSMPSAQRAATSRTRGILHQSQGVVRPRSELIKMAVELRRSHLMLTRRLATLVLRHTLPGGDHQCHHFMLAMVLVVNRTLPDGDLPLVIRTAPLHALQMARRDLVLDHELHLALHVLLLLQGAALDLACLGLDMEQEAVKPHRMEHMMVQRFQGEGHTLRTLS